MRNVIGIRAHSLMQPCGRREDCGAEPQPQEQHPDGESARARKALGCVSGEHGGYFKHEFDGEARVEIQTCREAIALFWPETVAGVAGLESVPLASDPTVLG